MKEKELSLFNKNSQLPLQEFMNIDLYELNVDQIFELRDLLMNNVKMDKLEEAITKVSMNLSGVAGPSFMADAVWLALDNQKRLEIIWKLLDGYTQFRSYTRNFKRNKQNCLNNDESSLTYLFKFKDLVNGIIEYSEFKIKEQQENLKLVEENKKKLLSEGENK